MWSEEGSVAVAPTGESKLCKGSNFNETQHLVRRGKPVRSRIHGICIVRQKIALNVSTAQPRDLLDR